MKGKIGGKRRHADALSDQPAMNLDQTAPIDRAV
jgi:hypothetical protein